MDSGERCNFRRPQGFEARTKGGGKLLGRDGFTHAAVGTALAAIVLAGFLPVLFHAFVWDDHEQIVDNPRLRSWSSLPGFFTGDILSQTRGGDERSNYYRPLFLAHYLANYQIFGPSPLGWHALALAHHWLASFAAWAFARRLGLSPAAALAVAALFALHPAHGESIGWVAAAYNDPPAATLSFAALVAYARWLETRRRWTLAASALAFLAALGFKESAVALLALLPALHQLLAPEDDLRRRLRAALPFAGAFSLYLWARFQALGTIAGRYSESASWEVFAATLPRLGVTYLRLLFWPWHFAPSYPLRWVADWSAFAAWGSLLLLAIVALAAVVLTRWQRRLGFALAWIPICLAPALNVRGFRPTYLVHQRYLYLAVFGMVLAGLWIFERSGIPLRARKAMVALVLALWGTSLWAHHRYWRSDVELWRRIAEVDPANAAAFDWLGERARVAGDLDGAEALFRRSVAADTESAIGACNLARLYLVDRRDAAASLAHFRTALERLERRPGSDEWRIGCEVNVGLALARTGDSKGAIARLLATAAKPPYPPLAARNAAVLLAESGRVADAMRVLATVLARHPDDRELAVMLRDLETRVPADPRREAR